MTHKLEHILIINFRSCKKTDISLADYTPLVGYNNGGKSNILAAIKWLLRRSSLSNSYFYDEAHPIVVTGVISGITEDLLSQLEQNHKASIEPFLSEGKLSIRRTQNKPNDSASKIIFEVRDPNIAQDEDGSWKSNPAGIDNAISVLFPEPIEVGAMENAEEDVGKWKTSTTIGKLISEVMIPVEQEHGAAKNEVLQGLQQKLAADGNNRAPELDGFDMAANEKLEELFPGIKIKIHVPSPEIKEVFKSGTIKVYEDENPLGRDVAALGHGAQRSIQMALIRHLADVKRKEENSASRTLLLIDEPELYLHPQAIEQVRAALKRLSNEGYQIIFSTHSPQMITAQDLCNALLIRKTDDEGTYARDRLADAVKSAITDAPAQTEMLFSLSNSSQILFCEHVVLIEGKTENRLLPYLFEEVRGATLGQEKIAVVKQDGVSNTAKALKVLNAMDLPAKAIVDLDYAFRCANSDGYLEDNDEDIVACKDILNDISVNLGINLQDGLPTSKNSSMSASEAFAELAKDERSHEHINSLHNKLLENGIWLWKKGACEHHLGIQGKTEGIWASFLNELEANGFNTAVKDHEGVRAMITWLCNE
jgi:putative ATP-dependent endonuclease of OLD family